MLRYALRRTLWMLPTLVVITLIAFGFLALLPASAERDSKEGQQTRLPLLLNANPRDVRSLAIASVEQLVHETDTVSARDRLARLGGAALPYVLVQLDGLNPEQRARVALALQPIAQRMGLLGAEGFKDGETAVLFWQRFWEERAVDFKPSVVRRAVRRLVAYGSLTRRTELVELDTYALEELIAALREVRTVGDIARVARLTDMAAHVTGREDRVAIDATVEEAARCVTRWRQWWLISRTDYVVLAGPGKLAAMVVETRYGHWALGAAALRLGVGPGGTPVLDALAQRGSRTLGLCAAAQLLAYVAGTGIGLLSALRRAKALDRALGMGTLALFALTPALLCAALAVCAGVRFASIAALIAACLGLVASPARQQRVAALEVLRADCLRAARGRGASPLRLLFVHGLRLTGITVASLAAIDFPSAFTAACVAEHLFGLPGLAPDLTAALRQGNVPFLMAFGLGSAALTAVLLVLGDVVSAWLDPRCRRVLLKEGG